MVSDEARAWLKRRVRVYAACDPGRRHPPMAEGVVVGYAAAPTITVRSDDGSQSDWQVTLPIEIVAEDAEVPPSRDQQIHQENVALGRLLAADIGYVAAARAVTVLRQLGLVR
jgi:hypothetical protein